MPTRDRPPLTRALALRGVGFGIATVLGAVAVWLIVTSDTMKGLQIGVLVGLWGLLLGAYSMFGSRRTAYQRAVSEQRPPAPPAGNEVATRPSARVERAEEAAERREYEHRLEQMLRREINTTMNRQVSSLRAEIAQLRHDLLEKVGGQLRLERIETTRLIGSDLEALQHEVRQLKVANETGPLPGLPGARAEQTRVTEVRQVIDSTPGRRSPGRRRDVDESDDSMRDVVDAEVVEAETDEPEEPRPQVAATSSGPVQPAAFEPVAAETVPAAFEEPPVEKQPIDRTRPVDTSRERPRRNAPSANPPQRPAAREVPATPVTAPRQPSTPSREDVRSNGSHRPGGPPPVNGRRSDSVPSPATSVRAAEPQPTAETPPSREAPTPQLPIPAATADPPATPPTPSTPSTASAPEPPASAWADDPFASLPRLRPFTEFELDPIETPTNGGPGAAANGTDDPPADGPNYTGRRRRSDEIDEAARRDSGRHSRPDAPTGGRRRRVEDSETDEDVLRQLLSRQSRG